MCATFLTWISCSSSPSRTTIFGQHRARPFFTWFPINRVNDRISNGPALFSYTPSYMWNSI